MENALKKRCARCHGVKELQKHHLFPKVHFQGGPRVVLCNECHKGLEHVMQSAEGLTQNGRRRKRSRQFYVDWCIYWISFTNK